RSSHTAGSAAALSADPLGLVDHCCGGVDERLPADGVEVVEPVPRARRSWSSGSFVATSVLSAPDAGSGGAADRGVAPVPQARPGPPGRDRRCSGLDGAPGPGPPRRQPAGLAGPPDRSGDPPDRDVPLRRAGPHRGEEARPRARWRWPQGALRDEAWGGREVSSLRQARRRPRHSATCQQLQSRRPSTVKHRSDGATALLGMPGLVVRAQIEHEREWWLAVETPAAVVGCEGCGTRAVGHGRRRVRVRDLPMVDRPVVLVWAKRLWRCPDPDCPMGTWSEDLDEIAPRAALTERARAEICRQVGELGRSVAEVARSFGVGWHTAM